MGHAARHTALASLKGLLKEKGFTHSEMAEILGTTANTFSKKINGVCRLNLFEALKLANFLSIRSEDLRNYFVTNKQ
ncbi:MAG: helix-turn-helix transcriptional regulator [Carboxydocellales bacterium]